MAVTLPRYAVACRNVRPLSNKTSKANWRSNSRYPWRRSQLEMPREASSLAAGISAASKIVAEVTGGRSPLPIIERLVGREMKTLSQNIQSLLGSRHPSLDTVAKYYAQSEGKHIRPLIVLLMARATSVAPKQRNESQQQVKEDVDLPLTPSSILFDVNPSSQATIMPSILEEPSRILSSQRRLAEITEMIHAASLLHDDVIDEAEIRRGKPSCNTIFGNKMAILAGDFLLGRASVALARLRDAEVVELLATVIANLVEGEFMQLKNTANDLSSVEDFNKSTLDYYLQKTYLKTASLISKSCRAAAILGGSPKEVVDAAYSYGRNLGLAFQLVDDLLDFTENADGLGKPAGADLSLGLATAPVLFAWAEYPELGPLIKRKFEVEGDVQMAKRLVRQSTGLEKTRQLAQNYSKDAFQSISILPPSEAKTALEEVCTKVLHRRK